MVVGDAVSDPGQVARASSRKTQRLGADVVGKDGANRATTRMSLARKWRRRDSRPMGRIGVVSGVRPEVELGVAVEEGACVPGMALALGSLRELTRAVQDRRQPISRL